MLAQVRTKLPRFFHVFFEGMVPAAEVTPCGCAVCRNLAELKLKVIVHLGRAVLHEIAGRPQISGADVILAHRLLKNSLPNREYLLMTEPAFREIGQGMGADFEEGSEHYEGFGTVRTWVERLDGEAERERSAFYALPPAAFGARIREYARWSGAGHLRSLAGHLRRPAFAVGWPRRLAFAIWSALGTPFMIAYVALMQPGRLRARHAAELRTHSGDGAAA